MGDYIAHVWTNFEEFDENLEILVSFHGQGVTYPHEGPNGTTVYLTDIENIVCESIYLDCGEEGTVQDYYNVFGEKPIDNLIERVKGKLEFGKSD